MKQTDVWTQKLRRTRAAAEGGQTKRVLGFRWIKFRFHHLRAAICLFHCRYLLKWTNEGGDALVHRLSSSFQGHFRSYWFSFCCECLSTSTVKALISKRIFKYQRKQ